MTKHNDDSLNTFQTFSTLLALLLPIVQFFSIFLPSSSKDIFVMKDILVPVSIISGVSSYLLIIAFKNTTWFALAFNRKKKKEYEQYQDQINFAKIEQNTEKREYLFKQLIKSPKKPPFYLTPLNVYYVLIPFLLLFTLVFLSIGIFGAGSKDPWLVLAQSISYMMTISFTSLTLAVFYINETNRKKQQKMNRDKYQKIIQLLFDNNSLPEYPNIEFVAQNGEDMNNLLTYIKVNNKVVYEVTTDQNGDVLKQVIVNGREE